MKIILYTGENGFIPQRKGFCLMPFGISSCASVHGEAFYGTEKGMVYISKGHGAHPYHSKTCASPKRS